VSSNLRSFVAPLEPTKMHRSALGRLCLFAGLTGVTTMLLLASWTSRPSAHAPILLAVLVVAAVFGVARVWPMRPGRGSAEG